MMSMRDANIESGLTSAHPSISPLFEAATLHDVKAVGKVPQDEKYLGKIILVDEASAKDSIPGSNVQGLRQSMDELKRISDSIAANTSTLNVIGDGIAYLIPGLHYKAKSDMASYRIDVSSKTRAEFQLFSQLNLMPPTERASLPVDLISKLNSADDSDTAGQKIKLTLKETEPSWSRGSAALGNVMEAMLQHKTALTDQQSYTNLETAGVDALATLTYLPAGDLKIASDMASYRIAASDAQYFEHEIVSNLRTALVAGIVIPDQVKKQLLAEPGLSDATCLEISALLNGSKRVDQILLESNLTDDLNAIKQSRKNQQNYTDLLTLATGTLAGAGVFAAGEATPMGWLATIVAGHYKVSSDMAMYRIHEAEHQTYEMSLLNQLRSMSKKQIAALDPHTRTALLGEETLTDQTRKEIDLLLK